MTWADTLDQLIATGVRDKRFRDAATFIESNRHRDEFPPPSFVTVDEDDGPPCSIDFEYREPFVGFIEFRGDGLARINKRNPDRTWTETVETIGAKP